MEQKIFSIEAKIASFEKVNSQFAKVLIYVLYTGRNRNKTSISKEVVQNALYSLKNIPVVGEWKENNFGGHGGKLEIADNDIEWIETTMPYGVVPSDTEIKWETVREKDGITENEYLTCTAYLWYKRYPELEKVLNDGSNQSMEVLVPKYHMDDEGYAVFDEIEFSALCILGKDSDPNKNVEPCFEGAKITNYSFNRDEFKQEFIEMLQELKFSLEDHSSEKGIDIKIMQKGGINLEEKDFEEEIITEDSTSTVDEDIEEEIVKSDNSIEESNSEETIENKESDYSFNEQEYKDVIADLQAQVEKYKNDYSILESEITELRTYKADILSQERLAQESAIFEQFDKELKDIEEYETLKTKSSEYELDALEKECFFILGKKNANFSVKKTKQPEKVKIDFGKRDDAETEKFDGLFEKYLKK